MCGIAGVLTRKGGPPERERLERMGQLLAHRGPDDSGLFQENGVGLVHRRLSILDLSPLGHQPMTEGPATLVYNGEIYNYRELQAELEGKGHVFRSTCDTEVLLKAYLEWGPECVSRFNGMFSFALWDAEKRRLFCARDRLGIKPFYYLDLPDEFAFASEPKALLLDPARRRLHPKTMIRFLGEGLVDDEPETFFRDIRVLPPAHRMIADANGVRTERYWTLTDRVDVEAALAHARRSTTPAGLPQRFPEAEGLPELGEAAEAFRELLTDSIRLRMRSDVPVGTCLSGGLDSSSIVCLATSLLEGPVCTFSSVYPQDDCNEGHFIDRVIEGAGTLATRVEPTAAELPEIFSKLCWHQDEPTAGPGLYSQWKVMEAARGTVTVLLDGQGGDELLAGYHHYFQDYLTCLVSSKEAESTLWREVEIIEDLTGLPHAPVAQRALRRARRPAFLKWFGRERPGSVKPPAYLDPEVARSARQFDCRRTVPDVHFEEVLNQKLYNDLTLHSIPALLRYEDRNSMAYSLEARVPFLDHRIVEFCFMLPYRYKIQPPHTKLLLRRAMNGYLPLEVLQRRDKMGYPTPASHWFRDELSGWVRDVLTSREFRTRGLFNGAEAMKVFDDHLAGQDRSWELWRFLSVEHWMRLFIDGEGFRSP